MTNEEMEIEAIKRYGNTIMNPDAISMKIGFIEGLKFSQSEIIRLKEDIENLKNLPFTKTIVSLDAEITRLKADVTGFAEWANKSGYECNLFGDKPPKWIHVTNPWTDEDAKWYTTPELYQEYLKQKQ